ncbi:hypothetical protein CKAH01_02508 [Colletotrichum kahawae]|uniref:Uncharacterized protein n=1 Tax=Colletotrichum kahawae TaxID=34407 RepID=A0AAD9XWK0_COLKA|nr:hypothetical protein CKAH01_02508 [Colletotrichum kahawae]
MPGQQQHQQQHQQRASTAGMRVVRLSDEQWAQWLATASSIASSADGSTDSSAVPLSVRRSERLAKEKPMARRGSDGVPPTASNIRGRTTPDEDHESSHV